MIEVLKKESDTIAIRVSDDITAADYDRILPLLKGAMAQYGKINLYCEVMNVEGIEPEAIWKDIKFDVRYFRKFRRVAMVGDRKWLKWMTLFAKPLTPAHVKYFDSRDSEMAMDWINASVPVHQ